MVQAAVANVIRPAIPADNPNALLDQHIRHTQQMRRLISPAPLLPCPPAQFS